MRETFPASLYLGEQILVHFGWSPEAAQEAITEFRDYDEEALQRYHAIVSERADQPLSRERAADELAALFAADAEQHLLEQQQRAQ